MTPEEILKQCRKQIDFSCSIHEIHVKKLSVLLDAAERSIEQKKEIAKLKEQNRVLREVLTDISYRIGGLATQDAKKACNCLIALKEIEGEG